MAARTGEQFLRGLKDGRELWVGGERVRSIVDHPALNGAAQALAEVFDLQHRHADDCLMPDPETGEPINVSHMIPRSRQDLQRRHRGLERVAEYSVGLMGRTPDYMNVTYAGFAGRRDEWAVNGNEEGADNLVRYQKTLAREDISLTHTIVHSTVDLAKGKYPVGFDPVQLHKVEKTSNGILVRGSRILATLAPFADELAVYPGGIMPNAADVHALSFCIPMDTPGLKFICRDSVAVNTNRFEHPLSSRFDEQDAFVIFDDVEVPRERLFIDANLEVYNTVMKTSWWPNILQQTMIRAQTKLEFAWGLATRLAEAINSASQPPTQQMLGELAMYAEFARSTVYAAEQAARETGNGMWSCDGPPLAALRAALPTWFPRVNEIIRLIGSHNLLTTPARAALEDETLRPLIDKYLRGVGIDAEQRSRLFRLAWDFTGTALGSRNEQYERFYLGSVGRNLIANQAVALADRSRANRLLDRFLLEEWDGAKEDAARSLAPAAEWGGTMDQPISDKPAAHNQAVTPRGINHLVLNVRDLEESHRFWTEIVGFRQVGELKPTPQRPNPPKMRFYSGERGGQTHHHDIALVENRDLPAPPADWKMFGMPLAVNHIAITLPDREAWSRQLAYLQARGVKFDRRVEHGMTHSLYIHDPNGYGIELLYDLPRDVWEGDIDAALNYVKILPTEGAEALVDGTDNLPKFGAVQPAAE